MRYAQMLGSVVKNIIELAPGATTWDGLPLVALSDVAGAHGVPVQPGDVQPNNKVATFVRPAVDPVALAAAKVDALARVDALNATLVSISNGSLKAQIAAATDPAAVKALQESATAAVAKVA